MKTRRKMAELARPVCGSLAPLTIDPTDEVDTLFGVGSATSAGPTLPAGSVHPSPETLEKDCGGYLRGEPVVGFGQAFVSGSGGTKCYGNYLLAPTVGSPALDCKSRASMAVKGSEVGRCYEYKVKLENGIEARVTPAHHAAIYEFTYPAGETPYLIFDVAHKLDIDACMKDGYVTVGRGGRTVCGGGVYMGNWSPVDFNMYFALETDTDAAEVALFRKDDVIPLDTEAVSSERVESLERFGVYMRFPENATVRVKISLSFVSVERAQEFLATEIPDFDYDAVREAAREAWRKVLGVIELGSTDAALLRRFYTAMYHMNIQPRDRTRDHGMWDDFHTVWDSWKTVFPMYSLLYPQRMGEIVDSMIDRAEKNKALGNGIVIGDEFMTAVEGVAGQGGNDVDNAISDAYLKGVTLRRHEWEDAYRVLLRSAEEMRSPEYVKNGYATENRVTVTGVAYTWRFRPVSATLGFAFNDKAVAAVARELGTKEEYERYEARSRNFLNVWNGDVESEGFYGFPQMRNESGGFDAGYDAHGGYNVHYYEATGWDASYINYNDVPHLIEAMGGAETFTRRLLYACEHSVNYYNDDHGKEGYLNFTNEPSFHIPWLFCTEKIRRPDLAARVIDGIVKRFSGENDYPGDEDNGGMSSYYVFLMCGFFPYATTENYYLHGTRVEEIAFRLGNGRTFRVTGENVGGANIYVQSATFRGEPLCVPWLTHADLIGGGELHFVMGDTPSDWGRR